MKWKLGVTVSDNLHWYADEQTVEGLAGPQGSTMYFHKIKWDIVDVVIVFVPQEKMY